MNTKVLLPKDDQQGSQRVRVIATILPIIVGVTIFLSSETAYWMSRIRMPKGGFTTIALSYLCGGFGHIVPFLIIAMIVQRFIRREASTAEIYLKLAFMLIPISITTIYWLLFFNDPLALGFLFFINIALLLVGLLIGMGIYKFLKESQLSK